MSLHPVEIDEPRILAELDQLAGVVAGVAGGLAPVAEVQSRNWKTPAEIAAMFLCYRVAPAWNVPREAAQGLAEAFEACLEDLMPGGLVNIDNWGPWGKLLYASGAVMMCGVDLQTFTFKPLRDEVDDEPGGSTLPAQPGERKKGGGFVMGGDNGN